MKLTRTSRMLIGMAIVGNLQAQTPLANFSQARCLKTGRLLGPEEESTRLGVLDGVFITADDLWPNKGQRLVLQLKIFVRDSAPEVELLYELRATRGIQVLEKPLLSSMRYKGGDWVFVRVPIAVLDEKLQHVELYVAGYMDGVLKDWAGGDIYINHGREQWKTAAEREPFAKKYRPTKVPGYTNQPIFVYKSKGE